MRISKNIQGKPAKMLIALNAKKSVHSIRAYRKRFRAGFIILILTGTDIYPEPDEETLDSMRLANAIVGLQGLAINQVPEEFRDKFHVVVQSAEPFPSTKQFSPDHFDACVVGHIREVKNPLLAARATRLLPEESKIRVLQAGGIIDEDLREPVETESAENPRFEWMKEIDPDLTRTLIGASRVLIVTSNHEGASRVVGEAAMTNTPVISTKIDGVVGLLGEDYPGYFPVDDEEALAKLLLRCENEPEFLQELTDAVEAKREQFDPDVEMNAVLDLFKSVTNLGEARPSR